MPLGSVAIGQYYPGESAVHAVDPRVKMAATFLFMVSLFVVSNFWGLLALFVFLAATVSLAGLPWSLVARGLRPILYFLLFTLLIHLFFTPGLVLIALGPLRITWEGIRSGLFIGSRLLLLVTGTSVLTLTTTPMQLTDAIEFLLKPLAVVRVPAQEIAMMMTIALRFIPTLVVEANKIMKSQTARGADFESGNVLRRARSYIPLLIPLFVSAFRRADELALAMESRLYRGGKGRSRLRELKTEKRDWLALTLALVVLVGAAVLGRI